MTTDKPTPKFVVAGSKELEAPPKVNGESVSEVQKAKEAADIAAENLKKAKNEAEIRLLERGWKSVEDGLKAIEEEKAKQKADKEQLEKDKAEFGKKYLELSQYGDKANHLYDVSVQMKSQAEHKYNEIVLKEQEIEKNIKLADDKIKVLQESYLFFDENIQPVLDSLTAVKKALYREAEAWQQDKNLYGLYNYVTRQMTFIEKFLECVKSVAIPNALVPQIPEQDNHDNSVEQPAP